MIYFIAVKMEGQRRKGCLSEGSWDVDPGREALGPFGFSVLGGPQGAVLRVRAELGDSLAPAAILLWKLNTESAQTSWLVLVSQRCLLLRDVGATVALEPQLFATWPEGSGDGG